MAEPTAELVRRAQEGREEALVELVQTQQRYIYSLCLSLMREPADAADVTQDVFIKLMRVLGSYRHETKFSTWLYRLTTNTCLDALRRRGKNITSLDTTGDWDEENAPLAARLVDSDRAGQPEAALAQEDEARAVRAALATLPVVQRATLTMLYFEGMRYEEIAEAMDLPLNTVKSHIRRGKEKLATLLDSGQNVGQV